MNLGALGRDDRAAAAAGGFESRGPGDRVYLLAAGVRVRRVYALLRAEMLEAPQPTALFRVRPRATEASRSLEVGTSLTRGGSDAFSLLLFITWRYGKRRSA